MKSEMECRQIIIRIATEIVVRLEFSFRLWQGDNSILHCIRWVGRCISHFEWNNGTHNSNGSCNWGPMNRTIFSAEWLQISELQSSTTLPSTNTVSIIIIRIEYIIGFTRVAIQSAPDTISYSFSRPIAMNRAWSPTALHLLIDVNGNGHHIIALAKFNYRRRPSFMRPYTIIGAFGVSNRV